MIFGGTVVASGRGRALVVATGMETELGGIARDAADDRRGKTPLQRSLDRVAVLLARAAVVLVVVVVGLGLLRGEPFLDMLLFGTALAVAVVPEALPAVITISLTLAAQRMIQRHVLVRRLPAIETLGSVTVIASDKTGTLTKDEMTARTVVVADEPFEVSGTGYEPQGSFLRNGDEVEPSATLLETLRAATLASDATLARDDEDERWRPRRRDRGRARRRGGEGRSPPRRARGGRAAGGRDPVHVGAQADDDAPPAATARSRT